MLDTVRRYVEAGRDALTPKKAEELARALIKQGQARADQAGRLARDLFEWSRKNSERFRETIRHEVQKQMSRAGVATKQEVDSLKRRVRELESKRKTTSARRATTQRSAGSRTATRGTTTRRGATGARKSQTTGATWIPRRRAGTRSTSRGTGGGTSPPGTRGA